MNKNMKRKLELLGRWKGKKRERLIQYIKKKANDQ